MAFLKEVHPPRASLRAVLPPRLEERVGHTPFREEAVRFGPDERLFGILTEPPPAAARPALPPILLLNAGCIHHVGPNRWYVSLARQLAQLGHRVLRFDLSGLGDSQTTPGCIENLMYPEDALHCVRAAMSMLATRHGPGARKQQQAGRAEQQQVLVAMAEDMRAADPDETRRRQLGGQFLQFGQPFRGDVEEAQGLSVP